MVMIMIMMFHLEQIMADWAEKLTWDVCLEKRVSTRMATWISSSSKAIAVQINKQTKKQRKPWQGQELGRQEAMVNAPPCSGCRPGSIKMKIVLPYQMGNEEANNKIRCTIGLVTPKSIVLNSKSIEKQDTKKK